MCVLRGYGFHHKKLKVHLREVSEFCYPCWFRTGYWWTVKMKDGSSFDMFLKGEQDPRIRLKEYNEQEKQIHAKLF